MGRKKKPENGDLPVGIQRKRGRYYLAFKGADGGQKMRAAGATLTEACAAQKLLGTAPPHEMPADFPKALWLRARTNARVKAVPFELTADQVASMIRDTGGRCPIAGIRFNFRRESGQRFRPWAPSIDRLEPAKGYVLGNCRIVSAYVNLAMNEFGEGFLLTIARQIGRRLKGG